MSELSFRRVRAGGPDCPSDCALDRLHEGELSAAERDAVDRHTVDCEACQSRMQERAAGFAALGVDDVHAAWDGIARAAKAEGSASSVPRLPLHVALGGALAIAAAFALVWLPARHDLPGAATDAPAPGDALARDTTRAKGGLTLRVHRKRGDVSEEVSSGERFHEGDILRLEVFLPAPGEVRVLGIESDGTLYTAWPQSPAQTRFETAGAKLLPGAVRLDGSSGRETLYALRCAPSVALPTCQSAGPNAPPRCPDGCELAPFVLDKGSP